MDGDYTSSRTMASSYYLDKWIKVKVFAWSCLEYASCYDLYPTIPVRGLRYEISASVGNFHWSITEGTEYIDPDVSPVSRSKC